jgi:predicted adenylyl cyclase CyaB
MRIRRVELLDPGRGEWDLRPQLTYKGPRKAEADYKTRREIQTHFDAPYAMAEVLEVCGLAVSMTIQKRRSSYRLDSCMVELDVLPFIGRFVEIEGPDEQTISATCRTLGLEGRTIHESYLRLAEAACRQHNRDSHRVTFAVEAEIDNGR